MLELRRKIRDLWQRFMASAPPVPVEPMPTGRAELFIRLKDLRERRVIELEQHRQDIEILAQELRDVQARADALQHALAEKQGEEFCASFDFTAQENRILVQLAEKSSVSLSLFIQEITAELQHLHNTEPTSIPTVHRDYLAMKKTMGLVTDGPSRQRRVKALHAARQRAEAMKLEPLTIEAMTAEILRLQKSIPDIEHQEIHNERARILAAT